MTQIHKKRQILFFPAKTWSKCTIVPENGGTPSFPHIFQIFQPRSLYHIPNKCYYNYLARWVLIRAPAFYTGGHGFKSRSHYSRRKCVFSKKSNSLHWHMSVIENALGRELWTPNSAHQCTLVVLDNICCSVAVVVLGLNWPVCSIPGLT